MATATADIHSLYGGLNSKAAIFGSRREGNRANVGCNIHQGVKISISKPKATALVIRPFVIGITPTEEGYMVSSHISNSYEVGTTPLRAVKNYLEFLVDELVWLQKNEENLSSSIHEDFRLLQSYLRIV
jgi:hypothetical protein